MASLLLGHRTFAIFGMVDKMTIPTQSQTEAEIEKALQLLEQDQLTSCVEVLVAEIKRLATITATAKETKTTQMWLQAEKELETIEATTVERCAQYHDKAAEDCEAIAAVNMNNKLGADCLTRAQNHRVDADAIRTLKDQS